MAKRDNHYEAAFEDYLRQARVPYVAVDEAKRSRLGEASLKSLDFIVSPETRTSPQEAALPLFADDDDLPHAATATWLIDIKGRRFPAGRGRQYWRNWSTRDDLVSLCRWQQLFAPAAAALFVFAYHVCGDRAPLPVEQLHRFRGRLYGYVGIRLADYLRWARPISTAWDTLAMPTRAFRQLAAPAADFFASTAAGAPAA
ncbi:MAG: hypothetical protein DWQ31_01765 [Planctomycetota bacterium]|nr:MAG: hypothetical protein DWQ31_01765 [Planctomycetota bacterium]REJ87190.1 MAG: hypothetical protein DWQ35_21835 [Planctomycetota bacterium]REK23846.1 MAG: hypothetical protein DWQ42_14340 [Planctomycetota bacterium]REK44718.1 MAG: hypothetical protein DWQ46_08745 [Planctomycetota bacterium]